MTSLWKKLIEKSIKCLRTFDENEPFLFNSSKKPIPWGVNELDDYFKKYTEFESMLYGGSKYYRDHIVHVFRVWILGVHCMLSDNFKYVEKVEIDSYFKANILEKISLWTLISLSHDLGYPLEKAQRILNTTNDMMGSFIVNPNINMDLNFNGIQNRMNEFILRFMSSKMVKCLMDDDRYLARLQPKYYFKFQKSLEKHSHGIISSIIIYKLLTYFLESDFNINEDYSFSKNEARQFYMRREILRSISSHTCSSIYHLNMFSFAFLLIICDDCQEWGRKQIGNLYMKPNSTYKLNKIYFPDNDSDDYKCIIHEEFVLEEDGDALKNLIKSVIKAVYDKYSNYKIILRDGPDTTKRNFSLIKKNRSQM